VLRLWAHMQVRFHVQVPAGRDLHAYLQVRRLTESTSRPGRSLSRLGARCGLSLAVRALAAKVIAAAMRLPGSNAIPEGSPRYASSPDLRRYVRV